MLAVLLQQGMLYWAVNYEDLHNHIRVTVAAEWRYIGGLLPTRHALFCIFFRVLVIDSLALQLLFVYITTNPPLTLLPIKPDHAFC